MLNEKVLSKEMLSHLVAHIIRADAVYDIIPLQSEINGTWLYHSKYIVDQLFLK